MSTFARPAWTESYDTAHIASFTTCARWLLCALGQPGLFSQTVAVNYLYPNASTILESNPAQTITTDGATFNTFGAVLHTVVNSDIFVSSNQINAIVPYEVANLLNTGTGAKVTVVRGTVTSGPLVIGVTSTNPAIFSALQTGNEQGAILNQDFAVNSVNSPAPKGSFVSILRMNPFILWRVSA